MGRTVERKAKAQAIAVVLGAKGQGILIAGALENLGERFQINAQSHGSIASVVLKPIVSNQQRYKRHMGRVKGLHSDTSGRAIKVYLWTNEKVSDTPYFRFFSSLSSQSYHLGMPRRPQYA